MTRPDPALVAFGTFLASVVNLAIAFACCFMGNQAGTDAAGIVGLVLAGISMLATFIEIKN